MEEEDAVVFTTEDTEGTEECGRDFDWGLDQSSVAIGQSDCGEGSAGWFG